MDDWRLRLFGTFQVEGTEGSVTHFGTTRAAKLLALLAFSRKGVLNREDLAGLLWPDDYYDATRLRLRQEIHRLRSSLREAGDLVWSNPNEVGLERARLQTDLDLLRDLQREPAHIPARFCEHLIEEFLPAWDEPWVEAERHHAATLQITVATAYAEHLLERGEAIEALRIAQDLIRFHPCDEGLRMIAVRAYSSLGSMTSAVAEYQQYRRVLKDLRNEVPTAESAERIERLLRAEATVEPTGRNTYGALPEPVDPLFGRTSEVEEVLQTLGLASPKRLVTLAGPGGIGKTRVAIEVAGRLAAAYEGRVAFVSLADFDTDADVARAILDEIGMHPPAGTVPAEYLVRTLDSSPQLFVLDNVEHLVSQVADLVQNLGAARPELRFLITSRTPLHVPGEFRLAVGPIDPMTDGLALLSHTAGRSGASAHQEASLRELAKRLDGFPLAIRLAGARLRVIPAAEMLAQLETRASVLATQSKDVPERHRSLDAALAGSLESLPPEDRAALDTLSIFPGGASYALATLAIPSPDAVEILERLVDSALVALDDRGPDVRFRLWGPVRDTLRDQRTPGEQAALAEAGARCVLAFARTIRPHPFGPVTAEQLRRFDEEGENIQSALDGLEATDPEAAGELILHTWSHDDFRARQMGGLARLRRLKVSEELKVKLTLVETSLLIGLTEVKEARVALERGHVDRQQVDPETAVERELLRGALLFRSGIRQLEDALPEISQAVEIGGVPFQVARLRHMVGVCHYFRREHEAAIDLLSEAFEGLESVGDLSLGGRCGLLLALAYSEIGRTFSAKKTMARAAPLVTASNDPLRIAYLHENEGRLLVAEGCFEEAEPKFRAAFEAWARVESAFQMADQLHSINRCLLGQGRYREAADVLRESGELWLLDGNAGGLCQSLTSVAAIHHEFGRSSEAADILGYAIEFGRTFEVTLVQTEELFREDQLAKIGSAPSEGPFTLKEAFRRIRSLPKA